MKPTIKKAGGWTAIRQQLATCDPPALIAIIKDLYDAGAVNRDLLQTRCLAGANDGEILEKYRHQIMAQFYPARGHGKLKLGEARKAIRDYRKATGSVPGTAELLMTYVETGCRFTREYGHIDERFYNSIESALAELAALICGKARGIYPVFAKRLANVESMSDGVGWGFHDYIVQVVGELEQEFGDN